LDRFFLVKNGQSVLISAPLLMRAMFKLPKPEPAIAGPPSAPAPELREAQMAAASYGPPMGGDSHVYIRVNTSRVLFALLDVAGSLDQNRAILSAAQNTLRSCGQQLLNQDDANEADAMIEVCVQMNRAVLQAAGRVCPCPAFAGCFNESLGTVCYVNAGYTPALLRDRTGITQLGDTGLPLGLFSHSAADASIVALEPGASLVLVSRGLVETSYKGKEFGMAQVKEILLATPTPAAEEINAAILGQVRQFLGPKSAVTVLSLTRSVRAKAFASAI
jgi:serine phosphatase RsbU (regulator of sigma subunit)